MNIKNTTYSYGSVAKFFHWLTFLLIAGLLAAGFIMIGLPNTPDKFKLYGLHKSLGIVVLTVAVLRLAWKLVNVAPFLPEHMRGWEKFLAKAGHALLYALIIAMPLSGWAMSSAAGSQVSVFGTVILPNLVEPDRELLEKLRLVHEYLAYAIIGVVSLHVLAALLHHFYYKDNVLRRMLPFTAIQRE